MEKYRLNNLLALAESFEFQALTARNDRVWALRSLISLADSNDILRFFLNDLNNFLGVNLSIEELTEWLNKNATFLNHEIGREWVPATDKYSSFLEASVGGSSNEFVLARIYKSPIPKESAEFLKVKESSLLQGSGKIPNLYLYKVIVLDDSPGIRNLDPKKYFKYFFLAEAFKSLFGVQMDNDFTARFIEYVEQHKHKLDKILSFASKSPKFIARGRDGAVFDIAPTYILKIFQDNKAYQDALTAAHRLHKNPDLAKTEAMIYDIGTLGEFDGWTIFYYIMEKMKPATDLPKTEYDHLTAIVQRIIHTMNIGRSYWREVKDKINDPEEISFVKNHIREGIKQYSKTIRNLANTEIKNLESKIELKNNWLESLIEEIIMKYLTGRTDLHMGNLGLTGYGEFRYFDPGYSGLTSNINHTSFIDQNAQTGVPE